MPSWCQIELTIKNLCMCIRCPASSCMRATPYFRQSRASRWLAAVKATIWLGARCHVGGEDVVRVAVQVLAGPVIPHRGTRVGVAGGDLDVAQVHPRVEHGRDEGYLYLILKKTWSGAVSESE